MFTELPSVRTGIRAENRYDDPKMWGEKFREFTYGAIGTGIAIGDFDGDGRPDLFVVCKTGPNHLFRNLGDFRFEDVTDKAGVAGPVVAWNQGAAFADVNNDGRLDHSVCRFNAPNLLYLNQGDGTFKESAQACGLAVTDACGMAAFCDYDRDGWLDVYIQTNILDAIARSDGQPDYLFHNRGDGTFENVTKRAGIFGETQGHSATWWDYNGDGWPDLYVANDYATPDQIYRNNGNGTFKYLSGLVAPHLPWFSMGSDVGDINNDGLQDLFVADMAATTHRQDHEGMLDMRAMVAEDMNFPGVAPQYMHNALFLNTGTGHYLEGAYLAGLAATDWTWSVRWEDLDNDGRLDLHVTNGMVRDFFNADLRARQQTAPSPQARERLIISAPELRQKNLAFRNQGDLRFEKVGPAWGLDQIGISFGAAFGDLDGDGDLDLVYSNYKNEPTVLRNDCQEGHRLIVALRGSDSNKFGVGATVRIETSSGPQVRQLVLSRGYLSTSEPILHFGLGGDELVQRLAVSWPSGREQVFENVAVNQRLTIFEPSGPQARPQWIAVKPPPTQFISSVLPIVSAESALDELAAQPLLPMRHNRLGPGVALGDLNADGNDDIVLGGAAGQAASVLLSSPAKDYHAGNSDLFVSSAAVADAAALIFDANGDGHNDLLLAKGGVVARAGSAAYQPHLYLGDANGKLKESVAGTLPELPVSAGPMTTADFDRDGNLDVFIGGRVVPGSYPDPPRSAIWRNRDGKFIDETDTLAPGLSRVGMVTAALWTDVDGDGWVDLLIALEWGEIRCWRNEAGRRFEDWSRRLGFESAGSGWWNSLVAADFNGDGQLDYAAGNLGLNTRYHATPEQPALLYSGVFEEGGKPQLIEAQYEGDLRVPLRGRLQVGAAVRSILKRFPTTTSYAAASLEEIFTPGRLSAAQRLAATEFNSGVFLSQPDGTYRFEALPRLAQIAPVFGMAAGDFDGDGQADLYLAQNSFAAIPEVGRFDGGLSLMLRGNGRGYFVPVATKSSGLVVTGDGKGVATGDFDGNGWPDFLVTRNNEAALMFLNRGVEARASFGISLGGSAGNPTAIGARISVVLADGATQMTEVSAGGGYLSQSSALAFFGFPLANPPKEIRVRWPSGQTSVHPWPGWQPMLRLTSSES